MYGLVWKPDVLLHVVPIPAVVRWPVRDHHPLLGAPLGPRAGRGGGDQADMGAGDGDVRVWDGTATVLLIECLQLVISTVIFNIAGAREWTISEFPSPTAPARVCKN